MTARVAKAVAFLRSAGLLAAVLAVVAGFIGMHVLTGSHAAHAAAGVPVSATAQAAATMPGSAHALAGHGGTELRPAHEPQHDHAAALPAHADYSADHRHGAVGAVGAVSDTCFGDCSAAPGMGANCVPSPKHADWEAAPPGTAANAVDHHGALSDVRVHGYPYLPGSPSPGELSISRT